MELSRRRLLLGGALGLGLAGCSSRGSVEPSSSVASSRSGSATASASATAPASSPSASTATLPEVTAWRPYGNDLQPACKRAAAQHVERLGNGPTSALQVIFAQYGGLLTDSASVLVVTRSWAIDPASSGGHTYDVRLSRHGRSWRVDEVHPSTPGARTAPSSLAREVLASNRIALPPAGRADVLSGHVHDSVLHAMLALAGSFHVGVSVVRSGHPIHVFGTDRLSDHPQGRAFDTWRIDGHPVVASSTPESLVTEYMHAAAEAGSYNVGGPYLLGSAPQWFSDDTHHDHVHAGFTT